MDFFKLKKSFLIKVFFSLILLTIPCLWVLQETEYIQKLILNKLVTLLQTEWDTVMSVKEYKINFFTGKINLKKGVVKNKPLSNKKFTWKFDHSSISFSRLELFFKDNFSMDVIFKNIRAKSELHNNSLDISNHLERVALTDSSVGAQLKSVTINNINLEVIKGITKLVFNIKGQFGFKKFGSSLFSNYWSGFAFINDGSLYLDEKYLLKNLRIQSIFSDKHYDLLDFSLFGNFMMPYLTGFKQYSLSSENNKIYFSDELNNADLLFDLKDKKIKGFLPIDIFRVLLPGIVLKDNKINIDLDYNSKDFQGKFNLSELNLPYFGDTKICGKFLLSENKKQISVEFFDLTKLGFDQKKKANCKLDLNKNRADFKVFNKKEFPTNGTIFLIDHSLKLYAKNFDSQFILDLGLNPHIYLKKILFINKGKKVIDSIFTDLDKKIIRGKVDFSVINKFIPEKLKKAVLSKSNFIKFYLDQSQVDSISGRFRLGGGNLSIVKSYNPIEKFSFGFAFNKKLKKIYLNNLYTKFFRGYFYSKKGEICFDDKFLPLTINIPITIRDFLFNWKDLFYTVLDSDLIYSKETFKSGLVAGKMILKKSLLKNDVVEPKTLNVSAETKESSNLSFFDSSVNVDFANLDSFNLDTDKLDFNMTKFDIDILNIDPFNVRAGLFNFDVDLDLNCKFELLNNNVINPLLTGNFDINSGFLNFLDKKLYIQYGKIQFLPSRMNDPIIDFVAKNKIKKYLISLQAAGSLDNPKVVLKSFPKLHKQEILSLLLSGSSEGSLRSQLSIFLQKKLTDIVVYDKDTSFFKRLLNPFRYVQITPNFINQSGKSGFKGSIDIDLNEQIHAKLQKDFNLYDDLSFQVDYFVADDLNFKFLRDQRGEVGAQVEVRFTL